MQYFRIKNWDRFQHYKNKGTPPLWIKLYRDLIGNYEYRRLNDAAKSHLIGIFLLASESLYGTIPDDYVFLAARIGARSKVNVNALNDWLIPCSREGLELKSRVLLEPEEKRREEKNREENTTASDKPRKLTPFQQCLEAFKARHLEVLQLPYDETHYSRDCKALKGPLQTYNAPAVLEMIGYFWDEQKQREIGNETWIGKTTPHIPGFVSKIPLILRDYTVESYVKEK